MSAPGNAAKLGTAHSNIQTATKLSVPGWERTYNALVSILLSQRISSLCQPCIMREEFYWGMFFIISFNYICARHRKLVVKSKRDGLFLGVAAFRCRVKFVRLVVLRMRLISASVGLGDSETVPLINFVVA